MPSCRPAVSVGALSSTAAVVIVAFCSACRLACAPLAACTPTGIPAAMARVMTGEGRRLRVVALLRVRVRPTQAESERRPESQRYPQEAKRVVALGNAAAAEHRCRDGNKRNVRDDRFGQLNARPRTTIGPSSIKAGA